MKKRHKHYTALSILLSVSIFCSYLALIYVVDPAGVNNRFDLGLVKNHGLSGGRTQKFVEMNAFEPNTLIIGGSRVHYLATKDVEKYTRDKVYNLGFSSANMEEQYHFLKYAVEHFDIKNVVIGLNLYTFSEKQKISEAIDFDKALLESGFTLEKQLKHYLEVPLMQYAKEYYEKRYAEPLYFQDGGRTPYLQSLIIGGRSWEEREKESNYGYTQVYTHYLEWGESGFDTFKAMVKLCNDHGINLKVFTTAVYDSQFRLLETLDKMEVYYRWKKELAGIVDYYDFMYPNSVTANSEHYVDPSHMKQSAGAWYFARVFDDPASDVPEDFGILVTKENVERHLETLRARQNGSI